MGKSSRGRVRRRHFHVVLSGPVRYHQLPVQEHGQCVQIRRRPGTKLFKCCSSGSRGRPDGVPTSQQARPIYTSKGMLLSPGYPYSSRCCACVIPKGLSSVRPQCQPCSHAHSLHEEVHTSMTIPHIQALDLDAIPYDGIRESFEAIHRRYSGRPCRRYIVCRRGLARSTRPNCSDSKT
jgi:hypothetical protein